MSSEEGGVGTTSSTSFRRSRVRRAGAARTSGAFGGTFRTGRFLDPALPEVLFAGPREVLLPAFAFFGFAPAFAFAARRLGLGRLAERVARWLFFPFLGAARRELLFRLAMHPSFRTLTVLR